jgi:hypothetical protein
MFESGGNLPTLVCSDITLVSTCVVSFGSSVEVDLNAVNRFDS